MTLRLPTVRYTDQSRFNDGVVVVAYRIAPDGTISVLRVPYAEYKTQPDGSLAEVRHPEANSGVYMIPQGDRILVLPDSVPRPRAEMARRRAVALLLTPPTLALDVVTVPSVALLILLGGGH